MAVSTSKLAIKDSLQLTGAGWGIYASLNWFTIGSGNDCRMLDVIWLSELVLAYCYLGPGSETNISEIWIEVQTFSLKKMHMKIFAKCRPSCLYLNRHKRILFHYGGDVMISALASLINSLTIVYSTVYSDTDQRKHKSSASLAFVRGIQRWPWFPRTKSL